MYPKELVNKKVIRTKPIDYNYYKDASFTKEPILILEANDSFLIYDWVNNNQGKKIKLESKWLDNNWKEFQ